MVITMTGTGDYKGKTAVGYITAYTLPGAPGITGSIAKDGEVEISWMAPSDTGSINGTTGTITKYTVYWGVAAGVDTGSPDKADVTGSTSYTITGLPDGNTVYFIITAWADTVEGVPSTESSVTLWAVDYTDTEAGTATTLAPVWAPAEPTETLSYAIDPVSSPESSAVLAGIDSSSGEVSIAADTSAGLYKITASTGGNVLAEDILYITITPANKAELVTAVNDGMSNWWFNGNLNYILTGGITDMSGLFANYFFNGNIDEWDTSNVGNMERMFADLSGSVDIGGWDTGKVRNMSDMFNNANSFNGDIGDWDTSNVLNMSGMFKDARAFNQDIGRWNTGSVTDMSEMFRDAWAFDQDIHRWNTGNVTDMSEMFRDVWAFNQDIGDWNTASVTDMSGMFKSTDYGYQVSFFNQDIGGWDTGSVTDMSEMFKYAEVFNQDIGDWNTGSVTDMSQMFSGASDFNQNLNDWNTDKVTDMTNMFEGSPLAASNNPNRPRWYSN